MKYQIKTITATKISASSTKPASPWKRTSLEEKVEKIRTRNRKDLLKFRQLHLDDHSVEASESPTRPPSIWSPQMPESQLIDWRVVRKVCTDVVGSTLLSSQLGGGKFSLKTSFLLLLLTS